MMIRETAKDQYAPLSTEICRILFLTMIKHHEVCKMVIKIYGGFSADLFGMPCSYQK